MRHRFSARPPWMAVLFLVAFLAAMFDLPSLFAQGHAVASAFQEAPLAVQLAPFFLLGVTLTVPELLLDVIKSFRQWLPMLPRMGTDFRAQSLKLNQTYTAHIPTLPASATYDTTTGYANGAQTGRSLLVDVPITVDKHKHVPLLWKHLDGIKDNKNRYEECISNAAYVLAKEVIDDLLSAVNSRNFSNQSIYAAADADYDMINAVTGSLNTQRAMPNGRTMLVNTSVANYLGADQRMISVDYAGQMPMGSGQRRWTNVGGFAEIIEYPDMPTNNGTGAAVTATASTDVFALTAHGFVAGDPVVFTGLTGGAGVTAGTVYYVIASGLTANAFKVSATRGGSTIDVTTDMSAGTVTLSENLQAFAFDPRAFTLLAGIPDNFDQSALAASLGIPLIMGMQTVTDPESGITMAAVGWQQAGTGDLYWSPTLVWGKCLGRQASTATANTVTDRAGHRIVTA